jgi:glycosyltransferase involved in cell wall biosynthesis
MTSIGSSSSVEASELSPTHAQLAIGLVSYNDAATIAKVAAATDAALTRDFSSVSSRILLADGGSSDGTVARARDSLVRHASSLVEISYPRLPGDVLEVPYHGLPGRPRALRAILTAARELEVESCLVIDAAITTMSPDWIAQLARPILQGGCDYVSPFYARHPYEGALTKGIVYPLFRALYGVRVRQPAATEFACSRRLLEVYLEEDLWEREGAETGIDVWLATTAAAGKFTLCEAILGPRGHHPRGEAGLDVRAALTQVVGAIFADLDARAEVWQRVRQSAAVPVIGEPPATTADAPTVHVDRWIESFRLGYRELREIWSWVLPPKTIIELRHLAQAGPERFQMDDQVWARIIYDFALAYRMRWMPRDHLLGSLTPLYLGWLASFVLQVQPLAPDAADARVERLAVAFEMQKPYLMSRWRWPEKFRT